MMKQLAFLLVAVSSLAGCEQNVKPGCQSISESVYVNERHPDQIEPYNSDSARVFTFESDFKDTVSILVNNTNLATSYQATKSNGYAGKFEVKAQPNEEIVINTAGGCAHFNLKEGYKYLYINRLKSNKWSIVYSNFSREYF